MTTMFHERERAFEAKFAHDEEFRFLVGARRDRLFAEWAAEILGLSREEGDALVKAVTGSPTGQGMIKPCCSTYPMFYLNVAVKFLEETHPLLSRDARKTHASKS